MVGTSNLGSWNGHWIEGTPIFRNPIFSASNSWISCRGCEVFDLSRQGHLRRRLILKIRGRLDQDDLVNHVLRSGWGDARHPRFQDSDSKSPWYSTWHHPDHRWQTGLFVGSNSVWQRHSSEMVGVLAFSNKRVQFFGAHRAYAMNFLRDRQHCTAPNGQQGAASKKTLPCSFRILCLLHFPCRCPKRRKW